MRVKAVLSDLDTGVWRWQAGSDRVVLDAEAARLLGLPPRPAAVDAATVRGRLHGVDYVELTDAVRLALAEGGLAEARLRVVDDRGTVVRLVRGRLRALEERSPAGVVGTLQEVFDPPAVSAGDGGWQSSSEWRLSREAFLLSAGRALAEARSTEQVLRVAASLAMPGFSPGGMAVYGVEGDCLTLIGHHGDSPDWTPLERVPLDFDYPGAAAVRTGRAIYIRSEREYQRRFPASARLMQHRGVPAAWAYLPLVVAGEVIGTWMASFPVPTPFTPDERSVLTTVARMLAQALSRAHVHDSERALSAGLQRSMMPDEVPYIPGLAAAARYVPTGGGLEIGGDWYDVIALPTGRTALVIGDVQGHDVRAAGLMSQLRIAIRAYASEGHRPDAVLARASRFLSRINEQQDGDPRGEAAADARFATCLYMEADPGTRLLTIARAGHLDPAMSLADGTMVIRPTEGGLPLGIEEDPGYPLTEHRLEPGETMLLCTDGLVETGGHDLYTGQARLQAAFQATIGADLEKVADAIIDAVSGPESYKSPGPHSDRREDDIALMLLRVGIRAEAGARTGARAGGRTRPVTERHMHMVVPQAEQQRIADARHQLRGMLHDWADPDQVDAAELALSETIANVIVHTDSTASVYADLTGTPGERTLRMTVSDSDGNLPHRRHPGEMASSGRGVLLLEALSCNWGVEPQGDGKAIWCEFYEQAPERKKT